MRKSFLLLTVVVVLVAHRIYGVINRPIPEVIPQPNTVRLLDELGRISKFLIDAFIWLGVNPASPPIKAVVNHGFGLIMNGIYRQNPDIKITRTKIADVPVKIIQPKKKQFPLPAIIYIHGGGWVWFSTDTYLSYLENLANQTQMTVIAIDYRKAPEHSFPSAYQDCIDVTKQVLLGKTDASIKIDKVLVAGDGAGGNLAAAVARAFPARIMIQILINPSLQMLDFMTPSYQDNVNALPGITSPEMEALHWLLYLGQPLEFKHEIVKNKHVLRDSAHSHWFLIDSKKHLPSYLHLTNKTTLIPKEQNYFIASKLQEYVTNETLSPMMHRNLKNIPKAYVISSQFDVLRDEAIMYTARMHNDDTRVKLKHYRDAFHGFFLFCHDRGLIALENAKFALQEMVEFLNAKVHGRAFPLEEMYNA